MSPTGGSWPVIVTAATCGSSREPDTVSSSANGSTNNGSSPIRLPWPAGTGRQHAVRPAELIRWSGSRSAA